MPPTYRFPSAWQLLEAALERSGPAGASRQKCVLKGSDPINKLDVRASWFLERREEEAGNAWWVASALDTLRGLVQNASLDSGLWVKPVLFFESGLLEIKTLLLLF